MIDQLAKDLSAEFRGVKGVSRRNLLYIRQWYRFYEEDVIVPQVVAQIAWGHNREIISKCSDGAKERDLEQALAGHIQRFLLELGQGFAYMGRQYPLEVGGDHFYLDLLFYHTRLRCYVVVELKATEFAPEYAGKLNFYLNVVNAQLKHEQELESR